MRDPLTVAFEIRGLFKNKFGFRNVLITIWHKDPCKDGTDDSCGWFIRTRHIDPVVVEKVKREFEFNFKHNYWFNEGGYPKFSTIGTALEMYSTAAWVIFMHLNNNKPNRKRHKAFMKKNMYDIIRFAENPTDSIGDSINMRWGVEKPEERIRSFTSTITADIYRKLQKWHQHPRWHIHHWQIQFVFWQDFLRKFKRKSVSEQCIVDHNLRDTV